VGWVEGEGKGGVKGLSSRAETREKVRGEYRRRIFFLIFFVMK